MPCGAPRRETQQGADSVKVSKAISLTQRLQATAGESRTSTDARRA